MTAVKDSSRNKPVEPNAFAGQKAKPSDAGLASVLGESVALWNKLVSELKQELKIDTAEWHAASPKMGWSLRLQLKRRNIVYLGPRRKSFLAAFALGDKAIAAARKSNLPADVLKNIADSKRYAEGTAVRIQVRTEKDVEVVKKLAKIKIEN